VRIALGGGRVVRGLVTSGGVPAPGADVFAYRGERAFEPAYLLRQRRDVGHTVTDADGRFAIAGMPDCATALLARRGPELAVRFALDPSAAEVELALQPCARVAVEVRDASGAPVAGASVHVAPPGDMRTADAEGRVLFAPVPVGACAVRAHAPGYASASAAATVVDGRESVVRLCLEPGARLAGAVLDEEGRGLDGVVVRVGDARAATGAGGRFELWGVREDVGDLRVSDPRGRFASVAVPAPFHAPLRVTMPRAAVVRGVVAPVPLDRRLSYSVADEGVDHVDVDETGAFELRMLPAGEAFPLLLLAGERVWSGRVDALTGGEQRALGLCPLESCGSITFVVRERGVPCAQRPVGVYFDDISLVLHGHTDALGHCSFPRLPAAEVDFQVSLPRTERNSLSCYSFEVDEHGAGDVVEIELRDE
jgi:hypothetical protein